ncbi:pilus assembly protein TadB [Agromyces protaetiae]|uniref:Pilus assembly protein TadB n=1 Tax=Agromyces protaetiae TaxID=2509455 RepID=A0A4P6FFF3_9MICO|nr:type II secretion system F family protein [Agromyces protaetiae]QAY74675.1 pilus assembly protein TadB [Agromyces protaetiae]
MTGGAHSLTRLPAWARPRRRASAADACETAATVAERLAVLLGVGVSPALAWRLLADALREEQATDASGSPSTGATGRVAVPVLVAGAAALAAEAGEPVDEAIIGTLAGEAEMKTRTTRSTRRSDSAETAATSRAWLALAAAWRVAVEAGAPLGQTLRSIADALRDEAHLARTVSTALAGPRASARMVAALPLVAVGFGVLLGFDTLGVLTGSPLGLACAGVGAALLVAGTRWNASLAATASRTPTWPGLESELLAVAMTGGLPLGRARDLVRAALAGSVPEASGHPSVDATVALSTRAGAPVAELLRADAARLRRDARASGLQRAETLAVRLLLPLGVCVLPAFVLLGVAPLMLSVVTGTLLEAP